MSHINTPLVLLPGFENRQERLLVSIEPPDTIKGKWLHTSNDGHISEYTPTIITFMAAYC